MVLVKTADPDTAIAQALAFEPECDTALSMALDTASMSSTDFQRLNQRRQAQWRSDQHGSQIHALTTAARARW